MIGGGCLQGLVEVLLLLGLLDEVLGDCLDDLGWIKLVEDLLSGDLLGVRLYHAAPGRTFNLISCNTWVVASH